MTSDSHAKQHDHMARLQSQGQSPDAPILLSVDSSSSNDPEAALLLPTGQMASAVVTIPQKTAYDERARLIPPSSRNRSPTSSASTSPSPSDQDRVYPWKNYHSTGTASDVTHQIQDEQITSERVMTVYPQSYNPPKPTAFTKLLAKAQSFSSSLPSSSSSTGFGIVGERGHRDQRRRNSILRVSSNKSLTEKPLKKCASVEFALHSEAIHKLNQDDQQKTTSNPTPRRLTYEEKEELYKIRPDLEVGPTPFFKEQMEELERQNQRRMLFAIVGGVLCLMMLMVVYYILTIA